MTRKQAALRAIGLLSGSEENREICEALERIAGGKLSQDWNCELALEAIRDFIDENGYYPTAKEMDLDARMPAHASLKLKKRREPRKAGWKISKRCLWKWVGRPKRDLTGTGTPGYPMQPPGSKEREAHPGVICSENAVLKKTSGLGATAIAR